MRVVRAYSIRLRGMVYYTPYRVRVCVSVRVRARVGRHACCVRISCVRACEGAFGRAGAENGGNVHHAGPLVLPQATTLPPLMEANGLRRIFCIVGR